MATKVIYADRSAKIRETFSLTNTADNVTIHNFDNLSNPDMLHDEIDLTSIFDSLGGAYTDGNNDLQDRVSAITLSYGDYDSDGKSDDVRMTIKGVDNFKVDFIDPLSPWKGGFDIGSGKGVYDDIAVMKTTSAAPVAPSTPMVPSTPTNPSAGTSGEYMEQYPAHWARLSNGINVERSELGKLSATDMKYLHDIGVQNFRVFINPKEYTDFGQAINPDTNSWFKNLKAFMDKAVDAGIAVVLAPFASDGPDYFDNPSNTTEINQYLKWMKEVATWVNKNYDAQDVFIETRNEPIIDTGAGRAPDNETWWDIQKKFIDVVREVDPDITIVATPNMWSAHNLLPISEAYDDKNIVYDIHYYQPMTFTSQGASWVRGATDKANVQWPGAEGKTLASVEEDFAKIKAWADAQDAFVYVGEFGVIKNAPADDRAQWLEDLRETFDENGWGWSVWEYNKIFGITTSDSSGNETVIDSVLKALDWGKYSVDDSPWEALLSGTPTGSTPEPTTSVPISTPPVTPSTPTATAFSGDSGFATAEKFTLTSAHLGKTVSISNFDSVSGLASGIKDQVDIGAIFDALGGSYNDAVNGFANRKAALNIVTLDINGDGIKDAQVTIDGATGFKLNFLSPNGASAGSFDIGDGTGAYDNILIA